MKPVQSQQPEFGRRLRKRREELGMSQRDLAADFVTASYISLLESGRRSPTLDLLVHLAKLLEMPIEALSGRGSDLPATTAGTPGDGGLDAALTRTAVRVAAEVGDYDHAADLLFAELRAADGTAPFRYLDTGLELQEILRAAGRVTDRLILLEELTGQLAGSDDPRVDLTLYTELATAQRDAGRLSQARKSAFTALSKVERAGQSRSTEHIRLLGIVVSILCELDDLDQVEPVLDELLGMVESAPPAVHGRAHWVAGIAYSQLGDHEAAHRQMVAAQAILAAPDTPVRDWLRFVRSTANVALDAGRTEEASDWLTTAERVADLVDSPSEKAKVVALRARYAFDNGDHAEAVERSEELEHTGAELAGPDLVRARVIQAQALEALGRGTEAEKVLRSAAELCEEMGAFQLGVQIWKDIDRLRR
ncbi:hypothetical protein SD37_16770 [Amycolatopsis orientalis]|uniref:HTH cro/C1-type domain-containing protein n=1 Tax=Amycolatopsis orientalis TaxID=31958 RepID=A0A193BY29_AMYOR|nr:helix-turn-helix domain-containing protein [Amycolatopsis orientalis]ANN17132.1 hypothetical protein SD37_16770 [Amycolatopsis orientalis]